MARVALVLSLVNVGGCATLDELVSSFFAPEDQDTFLAVAFCESSADPNDTYSIAVNPKSGATGWFQHLPKWWSERSKLAGFGGRSIYDPTAQVAVASWLFYNQNKNERWGGLSHWYPSRRCLNKQGVEMK